MIAQIKALGGPARHFESDRSLSCHNCPDVVQALNLLAVLFQDEVTQRKLMAVPTVCMNGAVLNQGRMGIDVQVHTRVRTTGISGNGDQPGRFDRGSPPAPASGHDLGCPDQRAQSRLFAGGPAPPRVRQRECSRT